MFYLATSPSTLALAMLSTMMTFEDNADLGSNVFNFWSLGKTQAIQERTGSQSQSSTQQFVGKCSIAKLAEIMKKMSFNFSHFQIVSYCTKCSSLR